MWVDRSEKIATAQVISHLFGYTTDPLLDPRALKQK